jgi:hypothetical protein
VVLIVLALVWGVVIFSWLRSRTGATFGDSVGAFRRHLRVLERTAPVTVRPANRLAGASHPVPNLGLRVPAGSRLTGIRTTSLARRRRSQVRKRRRDVLIVLLAGVILTLVVAVATRSRPAIFVQLFFDAALVSYLALLVRLRNLAAERELKLTFLPRTTPPARRTTRPSYAVAGYDVGAAGYGDLGVRRAAN